MPTVLVAGGAGFIGSNLCEKLLQENFKVICLDNLITGNRTNVKNLESNPNFSFIQHDITKDLSSIESQISNINYIFHLASPASPSQKSSRSYMAFPIETLSTNSLGTHNLLEMARKSSARFLYASTSEVYGDPAVSPQSEEYFGNVNPNGPRSVYDEGKRFGEALSMAYVRKHDLDVRIARIFNTYGSSMQPDDGRVVSNFIIQAIEGSPITIYGKGEQTRSFCYVSDMVEALYALMFTENMKGEVINLGNPTERKIIELANVIKELTESNSEIVFEDLPQDDPAKRKPDITKAKKLLKWEPKVDLQEGLKKTIEYFRKVAK